MINSFNKAIYSSLSVAMLFFISCQYDNNSTVYYDVTPFSDSITATTSFSGYALKDTVTLSAEDSIPYQITISSGELVSAVFRLDTLTLTSENNYIQIDTIFTVGETYPLTLSLHVSTQTGSLADIKGLEGINFEDSTMLYVKFVEAE
ncbi:MAG: hypothetical protein H6Q14_2378 [Bacteroidetes bacterium]|jgi:hypothetical protein|nr:hypothetical protein [Bacteroidota bacterium]